MNPTQTSSLPCEENRPADETTEAIVIPFPGAYTSPASEPATDGQPIGKSSCRLAPALTEPWDGIGRAHAITAEREERIRALTDRWNALMRFRAQTAEREQRIRALTERWNAIRQARA
ncbi:MAG TPA: hypothetical protein VMC06_03985 [Opitutaceae bacterium]|nr:hypothetical protein [Opitutaceae bacterium]